MEQIPQIEVENIGHLGLVAALAKKYEFFSIINSLLPKKSNNKNLTHADSINAMIYMGLGFGSEPLYLVREFFKGCDLEQLFRPGIEIDDFNDDVLGRALDEIYNYGAARFYFDVAARVISKNKLFSKFVHLDSSSISFTGKKYKGGNIEITYGHSKNNRPDLKQLVQLLFATDDGLPFWSESFSGNASDKVIFQKTIKNVQKYIKRNLLGELGVVVADSSLYTKDFLLDKKITGHWITRVPESIKKEKQVLQRNYPDILWSKIDSSYKFVELTANYANKSQRWIIIENRRSRHKEIATLHKNLKKDEERIENKIYKLQKKIFYSKEDIKHEKEKLAAQYPLFKFKTVISGFYERKRGKKRAIRTGYTSKFFYTRDLKKIYCLEARKGKYILATNELNDEKLSSREIINQYKGRNKSIESNFKFLKSNTHCLSKITLRNTRRIEAMMAVMSLSLLLNNLGQGLIRKNLKETNNKVPNQLGKMVDNPSLTWVFKLLRKIVKVKCRIGNKVYEHIHGLEEAQQTIINCLGREAALIYGHT